MPTVGVLNIAIKGSTAGLQKSVAKVGGLLKGLAGPLSAVTGLFGGITAGGALVAFDKMSQKIDAMAKAATTLGITTEELSELRFVAQRSGIEIAGLENSLQRMRRSLGEASMGRGTGVEALKALNLEADELIKLPIQEQLMAISRAMQDIPNASQRIAVGFQLFGRQGVNLIRFMQKGDEEIKSLIESSRRFGATVSTETAVKMERFQDAMLNMKTALAAVGRQVADFASPFMIAFAETLADLAVTGSGVGQSLVNTFKSVFQFFVRFFNRMQQMVMQLAGVLDQLAGGFAHLVGELALAASKSKVFSESQREFLKVLAEEEFSAANREIAQGSERLRRAASMHIEGGIIMPAVLEDFFQRVDRIKTDAREAAVEIRALREAGQTVPGTIDELTKKKPAKVAIGALERGSAAALSKVAEIFQKDRDAELGRKQLDEQTKTRVAIERLERDIARPNTVLSIENI